MPQEIYYSYFVDLSHLMKGYKLDFGLALK